jgi:hypothetical protein
MNPTPSHQSNRKALIDQIAAITTMQPGTLAEEWRERPDPNAGDTQRIGPYYKHQVWRGGRNISRRVPASEAAQLREDIDNAKRYAELTGELARINIEHTLQLRSAEPTSGEPADSKKNSTPKRGRSASPKPKPSLPKPRRG